MLFQRHANSASFTPEDRLPGQIMSDRRDYLQKVASAAGVVKVGDARFAGERRDVVAAPETILESSAILERARFVGPLSTDPSVEIQQASLPTDELQR